MTLLVVGGIHGDALRFGGKIGTERMNPPAHRAMGYGRRAAIKSQHGQQIKQVVLDRQPVQRRGQVARIVSGLNSAGSGWALSQARVMARR